MKTATLAIDPKLHEESDDFASPTNITVLKPKDPVDEYFQTVIRLAVLEKTPDANQHDLTRLKERVERMRSSFGRLFGDPLKKGRTLDYSIREYRVPSPSFEGDDEE